jgi:bifunctional non-homologous end joining protein LigD
LDKGTGRGRKELEGGRAARPPFGRPGSPPAGHSPCRLITHEDLALLESRERPFSAPGWIFEMKYDGHRCLSMRFDATQMISREGWDMSRAFPQLIRELAKLPPRTAIDGELLMADEDGRPQYDTLLGRAAISAPGTVARSSRRQPATIVCWDILMLEGEDLRDLPLLERKAALRDALLGIERFTYADHVFTDGERMYAEAEFLDLEGIVAKRADSPYVAGRTTAWLKIKTPIGRIRESGRIAQTGHA